MTSSPAAAASSPEDRLDRLIERLLASAEAAVASADWVQAQEFADDVLTVDPDNPRAAAVVEAIAAHADEPGAQPAVLGERALMSILFSDLVGSTPMAEQAEPETLRDVFRIYRERAEDAVTRYEGRIVQFLGDGIVATFGYPQPHEDDARRSVEAALDLAESMARIREDVRSSHGVELEVRVGIHSGLVVVADLGGTSTIERDAIVGTAPNLASRLQAEAEPGMVVVSDVTRHVVEPYFEMHSLGVKSLKGITRPVEVFAVDARRLAADLHGSTSYTMVPTVGREDVTSRLDAEWREEIAAAGRRERGTVPPAGPPAVLLIGDAGIGKTRTISDLCRVARSEGELLELACLPYYTNLDLWPVGQMLERFFGFHDHDAAERLAALTSALDAAELDVAATTGLLAVLVGIDPALAPAPELDPPALRAATIAALTDFLATPTGRPRLITAEDLHWADPSTLELLGGIASAPSPGVMLVMTARPGFDAPWIETTKRMQLDHLDAPDAEHLVEALVGESLTDEMRRSIVARSDGIPLFIEELARSAMEAGDGADLPLRLQELLTARLRRPGVDLSLAQIAATLGTVFEEDTLGALVGGGDALHERLERLVGAGVLDHAEVESGAGYRFRHALLRDAAYETQVLDARRRTHLQVADHLVAVHGDAALVAYHLDHAGAHDQAVVQYMLAAQAAQGRGAHAEATRMLDRALELVAAHPAGGERDLGELNARMLRAFSVSSVRGYADPAVLDDFQRAEELSQHLGALPQVLPAMIGIWSYSLVHGDVPGAGRVAQRMMDAVEEGTAAWFSPEVDSCIGFQQFYEGDLEAARRSLTDAIAGYDARPPSEVVSPFWSLPNDPVAVTAVGLACVATLHGDSHAAAQWEERAVQRAAEVPFPRGPFSLAFVAVYLAWLRSLVGDREGAEAFGREVSQIGLRHGYAYWSALGSVYHGTTGLELEPFEQSMAVLQAIGHEAFRPSYLVELAMRRLASGDRPGAAEAVTEAIDAIDRSGERVHLPEVLRMRALVALEGPEASAADVAQARADLERAVAVAMEQASYLCALDACNDLADLNQRGQDGVDDVLLLTTTALAPIPASSRFPQVIAARRRVDAAG